MLTLMVIWWNIVFATDHNIQTDERPNIIIFLVDDLGWQDTSVAFHEIKTPYNKINNTPNMERLAASGVMFTKSYTASPVCTPSRTSIMTGQHPARNNITNWTLHNSVEQQETAPEHYPLRSPNWNVSGLQPNDITLPELLRESGYRTIHIGKAHFGALGTPGADPLKLGFDINIGGHAAGAPGSYYGEHNFSRNPGEESIWDVPDLEEYHGTQLNLTEVLTLEARKAISEAVEENRPFFLNMAHYAVHTPIMADSAYIDNYQGMDPTEAAYFSMIEGMDYSLGMILGELERLNIDDNTLIIFTSDDGALSAHTRGQTVLGTGLNTHNLPLISGKGSAYEGGSRVPLIISWGRSSEYQTSQQILQIVPGLRIDNPVFSTDLFPTIVELANAEIPGSHTHDGESLLQLINGQDNGNEQRSLFWHYPHKWGPAGPGIDPFTSIRSGDWKLIYFYDRQKWELYNINDDISETRNMIRRLPEKAEELSLKMANWMKEVDAQLPIKKETGKSVLFPVFIP
ncbi:MAG: sulfatase [Balneolaceae bacterium]|nr:sulfatase [Balneolaceae bacterium]